MTAKQGKVTKIKFEKKGTGITLRVIGLNSEMLDGKKSLPDPAAIDKTERAYFADLHKLVDLIFMEACELEWTWSRLAEEAGIGYMTVDNLGMRRTKRPQYRTIYRMASAVGFEIVTQQKPKRKSRAKAA
jgi:DNA-binding phage protein